ncbi:MAG: glycosyltransferase family 39 protein [Polyangiaceae bacterium]
MTTLLSVLALLLIPAFTGVLLVRRVLGRSVASTMLIATLPLGTGLGLGLSGLLAFLSLVLLDRIVLTAEVALALVVGWSTWRLPPPDDAAEASEVWTPGTRSLLVGLLLACALAVAAFTIQVRQAPHGGWDAWDYWNMHARFLFRGGEAWQDAFSQVPWWTHPEYPLLLPAMVARGWCTLASESTLVPITLSYVFTFSSVAVLYYGVHVLVGRASALAAGILLVGTPYFVLHGSEQYADAPLAFFFLATMVCVALYDRDEACPRLLTLAGAFCGLSTFLKNDGLLFLLCLVVARGWLLIRRGDVRVARREAWAFGLGLVPGLGATLLFKLGYAVTPDSAEFYAHAWREWPRGFFDHVALQASNTARLQRMLQGWGHYLLRFDQGVVPLVFVLLGYGLLTGRRVDRPRRTLATLFGTLVLLVLGVSLAFWLWSTYEVFDHMDALTRLLTQWLPMALFALFLALRPPWERRLGTAG